MIKLLEIQDLTIEFETDTGTLTALRGINLHIEEGEAVAIVGESGSGKSTLAFATMQYLAENGRQANGRITFQGQDLSTLSRNKLRGLRGSEISMVFQDPATSFNPTLTIGEQIEETIRAHGAVYAPQEITKRAASLLEKVRLPDPATVMRKYPHQLSGGEKQRALIASAISTNPKLLIMDEPTTALDVTTAAGLVSLLKDLQRDLGVALLYITHDLGIMAQIANRAYVMFRGEVVESGPVSEIVNQPKETYTQKLLESVPNPDPSLPQKERHVDTKGTKSPPSEGVLLQTNNLGVRYAVNSKSGFLSWARRFEINAVKEINIKVGSGESVALIGESGCGKSTIARALVGLNGYFGEVIFDRNTYTATKPFDQSYRRDVQMVFQHPDLSLNPRIPVKQLIGRPLTLQGDLSKDEIRSRVEQIVELVKLPTELLSRYSHQLSGGQKQRVAIARAFITNPKLVICDEITSGLDVTVQESIMGLLTELQSEFNTSYLFITHDINLVRTFADRIYTMYFGDIVDERTLSDVSIRAPYHPYTEILVKSALPPKLALTQKPVAIAGNLPSRLSPPSGCAFATRCPRKVGDVCDQKAPPPVKFSSGQTVHCHVPYQELSSLENL
ncbi:dipeptide ABC transporter ATP-binding protein [Roseovarius sp. 2305UL8-3]|uniref:dipeptide ABC transporter ATP-binding protein n=1 Tax=Roseovarius conchicola TaxID=3121636 RepID=UPI003527FF9C